MRLSRIEVWSSRTSRSPRFTGSPFSLSTASTMADTSARRSARRSGSTEPVIEGPEVNAALRSTNTSSSAMSSGGAAASACLPLLLSQPVRETKEKAIQATALAVTIFRILGDTRTSFKGLAIRRSSNPSGCTSYRQIVLFL